MGEGVRDDPTAGRMVWTVIRRVRRAALATGAVIAVAASMSAVAVRSVADVQPGPSSQGTGALTHGKLVAGAGGTYLPIIPADITPGGTDPRNPLQIPPPGVNPQGMTARSHLFHVGPGSPSRAAGSSRRSPSIPTFTKNAAGGYDGFDARFGYAVAGAIPPGGNPADTAGKPRHRRQRRRSRGRRHGIPAHPRHLAGRADGRTVRRELPGRDLRRSARPYLAGDAPPPVPPVSVLSTPPFPIGADLVAALTRNRGRSAASTMLPGLRGDVAHLRAHPHLRVDDVDGAHRARYRRTRSPRRWSSGYTLFLLYDVTVTPGPVAWSWGDGTSSIAPGPVEHGPATPAGIRPVDAALDRSVRGEPRLRDGLDRRDDHRDRDVHRHDHGQLERRRRDPHPAGGLRCHDRWRLPPDPRPWRRMAERSASRRPDRAGAVPAAITDAVSRRESAAEQRPCRSSPPAPGGPSRPARSARRRADPHRRAAGRRRRRRGSRARDWSCAR